MNKLPPDLPIHREWHLTALRMVPRILTQVCRDPSSPFFGCFDRNWWHYKIRDYPSVILQQGAYALYLASRLDPWQNESEALLRIAKAGCVFWNERALRHGAFEEYYPWEQGYPPLAFGTLAVLKLHLAGVVPAADIAAGARIAALQLKSRFESQAANQQVAGLAALAAVRKAFPEYVSNQDFLAVEEKTLALQHSEGWFVEYEGPDLGYLSVTIDCLWDLFDWTDNPVYTRAAEQAARYIAHFTDTRKGAAGMHNARNTDYLVPYGLARLGASTSPEAPTAHRIMTRVYQDTSAPNHFFSAIDDRYLCHYIGHSVLRALLEPLPETPPPSPPAPAAPVFLQGSGHALRRTGKSCGFLISLRKGGIFTLTNPNGEEVSDFGWIVETDGRQFVNHWWSLAWQIHQTSPVRYEISGRLLPHREQVSSPWKHAALRAASFLFGWRIIRWLKHLVIFKKRSSGIAFTRKVVFSDHGALVEDRFAGLPAEVSPTRAPRASKRHVASADSYHPEDLALNQGFTRRESREHQGNELVIRTEYASM